MGINNKYNVNQRQLMRRIGHYRQRRNEVREEIDMLSNRLKKLSVLLGEYNNKIHVLEHEVVSTQ